MLAHTRTSSGRFALRARAFVLCVCLGCWPTAFAQAPAATPEAPVLFLTLLLETGPEVTDTLEAIDARWEPGFVAMTLETLRLIRNPSVSAALFQVLRHHTGQSHGYDLGAWQRWMWNHPEQRHPGYARFKSALYGLIDPRFANYFADDRPADIRLDEVVWGGVRQDGIPPLRGPKMLDAAAASYLADDNVVFGIEVNGDARAYPKRILAWHEMFVDTVGGVKVAGVYCTLCGTVILYETEANSVAHRLGTSGFLYRSNKLMYDQDTQSLWNTFWGAPVIGPLVGQDIKLPYRSVVTTTWGEWRRRHPDTQVLSLDTGHRRNYDEGEAYRAYFATDDLMFDVPVSDERLANKAEVLGVISARHPDQPLAIAATYLAANPLHHDTIGELEFVVLTDGSGANRVYESSDVRFDRYDGDRTAVDEAGKAWTVSEGALTAPDGRTLPRLPAYRAFWFGWYSAYAHTRLVR